MTTSLAKCGFRNAECGVKICYSALRTRHSALENHRLEGKRLLRTRPAARLAADAVARVRHLHEHLGRIFLVHLFEGEDVHGAYLVAAAATDAGLLVDGLDELRGPFLLVSGQSCDVSHFTILHYCLV